VLLLFTGEAVVPLPPRVSFPQIETEPIPASFKTKRHQVKLARIPTIIPVWRENYIENLHRSSSKEYSILAESAIKIDGEPSLAI
jgi:hypothetical protein